MLFDKGTDAKSQRMPKKMLKGSIAARSQRFFMLWFSKMMENDGTENSGREKNPTMCRKFIMKEDVCFPW